MYLQEVYFYILNHLSYKSSGRIIELDNYKPFQRPSFRGKS